MPHIVAPVRSSLPMQMLLEGNLYVVLTWSLCYILHSCICATHPLSASVLFSVTMTALVESLRLYGCYALNLSDQTPRPKQLLYAIMPASVPLLYVKWQRNDQHPWLQFLVSLWAICVTLELILAAGLLWTQSPEEEALPNWCNVDSSLKARRRQQYTPGTL